MTSQLYRRGHIDFGDLNWTNRRYDSMRAYSDSEMANLLFTAELQRRLSEAGSEVRAVAAHPGIARTNLAIRGGSASATFDRFWGWLFHDAVDGAFSFECAET